MRAIYRTHRHAASARATRIATAGCVAVLVAALAGCSSFSIGGDTKPLPDPNLFPDNYKALLLTRLQTNPFGLAGAREAFVSTPALKPFGTESRYFSCLRVTAPDMRKDKLVVFFGGEINQFIDPTGDECATATYLPFPEMTAALGRFGGKK